MARKRMLDSEIWRDRKVIKLSNEAFILWIAIISMADDEGIFEYDPEAWFYEIARKEITAERIATAMQEIIDQEMVVMYEDRYGFIPAWYKHQVLSHATRSKNKRPPAGVVKLYPEYISSWVKTFTTYRKTPEGDRESIVPEYPFRELNGAIPDDCGIIPENSGEFQKTPGSIEEVRLDKVSIVKVSNREPQAAAREPSPPPPPLPGGNEQPTAGLPDVPDPADSLYAEIKTAFEAVNGDFSDYAKEGAAIKRIIKLTRGNREDAGLMIKTFFGLRQRNDRYWSTMPFVPSRLAASGIWDSVKEAAKKSIEQNDVSWIDEIEAEAL